MNLNINPSEMLKGGQWQTVLLRLKYIHFRVVVMPNPPAVMTFCSASLALRWSQNSSCNENRGCINWKNIKIMIAFMKYPFFRFPQKQINQRIYERKLIISVSLRVNLPNIFLVNNPRESSAQQQAARTR